MFPELPFSLCVYQLLCLLTVRDLSSLSGPELQIPCFCLHRMDVSGPLWGVTPQVVIIYRQHFGETQVSKPKESTFGGHSWAPTDQWRKVSVWASGPPTWSTSPTNVFQLRLKHRLFAPHLKWFSHLVLTLAGEGGWAFLCRLWQSWTTTAPFRTLGFRPGLET